MPGDTTTPERGLIYARASQDKAGEGTSVEKQIENGLRFVKSEGITLVCDPAEVCDNSRSAMRGASQRPGFVKVCGYIEEGMVDVLILWEVSRSSRDLAEHAWLVNLCEDQGVEIALDGKRYDPSDDGQRMALMQYGVMADFEGRRIKKRNQASVNTNAQRGTPHGRLPYGYQRVYDPRSGVLRGQTPWIKIDEAGDPVITEGKPTPVFDDEPNKRLSDEAQVIYDAVHEVLRGGTLRGICRDLNARGVPNPRQARKVTVDENPAGIVREWTPPTLRQRIKNPTVAGRRVHQGEDIGEAAWDPIVDYGDWLRMVKILNDPDRRTVKEPKGPAPRHLVSRIARCFYCGFKLKVSTNQTWTGRAYVCEGEECRKVTAKADRVEECVEAVLAALFARDDFRMGLTQAFRRREEAAKRGPDVGVLIAQKEAELVQLDEMRENGEISLRAYGLESVRIETAIEDLRERQVAVVDSPAIKRLLAAKTIQEGWETADLMDKREVIRVLLDVRIRKPRISGRNFDKSRVIIEPSEFLRGEVVGQAIEEVQG